MPSIDRTADYAATPERLWAVVSDLPGWGEWLTVLREWTTPPPGELRVGAQLAGVISVMSIPMPVTWTIDECEPSSLLTLSGPAVLSSRVTLSAAIDATASGSRAHLRIDVENPILAGPLSNRLMSAVRRDVETSMANLRTLLT